MLKNQLNIFKLLFIVSYFFIAACNNSKTTTTNSASDSATEKKTETNATQPTVSTGAISGIYTITDARIKTGDGAEVDVYDKMDSCQKHNTYGFNKDMVWYLGGVAGQSCTGPDESGTWLLNGNTLTINSKQSGNYSYTIKSFDGKELVVTSEADDNGIKSVYTTVFTKQ